MNKEQDIKRIAANTLSKHRAESAALCKKHGINMPDKPSQEQVDAGFAALIKRPAFRKDFAQLAARHYSQNTDAYNFEGYNASGGPEPVDPILPDAGDAGSKIASDADKKAAAKADAKKNRTAYKQALFSPEFVQGLINTGLGIWAAKTGAQTGKEITTDLGNSRDPDAKPKSGGVPPAVLIVGGIGVLALATYLVVKNLKNK